MTGHSCRWLRAVAVLAMVLAFAQLSAGSAAATFTNPTGKLTVPCVPSEGDGDVVVFGVVDDGYDEDEREEYHTDYQLKVVTNDTTAYVGVDEGDLESPRGETIDEADVGSTIELQYRLHSEGPWTTLDGPHTVRACQQPSGQFTTECTPTGARADVGALSVGDYPGGTFTLVSGAFSATVTSNQQDLTVPPSSSITLQYARQGDANRTLDTEQSPAPCPEKGTVDKTS